MADSKEGMGKARGILMSSTQKTDLGLALSNTQVLGKFADSLRRGSAQ